MHALRELRPVDADFAHTGPNHKTIRQNIPKSADAVFRALEDGPAWKEWLGIDVEWTSPKPFGVGTTRTVRGNGQQIDETFLVWEPGQRMAFRFDRATPPLRAFAEDYVITSTGENSCELAWSYALEWAGPFPAVTGRAFALMFRLNGRRALKRLAEMMENTTRFDDPA